MLATGGSVGRCDETTGDCFAQRELGTYDHDLSEDTTTNKTSRSVS